MLKLTTKKSNKKATSFSLFTCYACLRKVPIVWISTSLKLFDSRKSTPLFTCIQRLFLNKTKIRTKLAACLKTKRKKQDAWEIRLINLRSPRVIPKENNYNTMYSAWKNSPSDRYVRDNFVHSCSYIPLGRWQIHLPSSDESSATRTPKQR